jgi:hypothetical protein
MTFELRPLWYGPEPNYERPLAAEINADGHWAANDPVYPPRPRRVGAERRGRSRGNK